jgi:hypothetical protein
MSTRANISLQWKTTGESFRPPAIEVMLYRHYDGYPDELGADIAGKILDQFRDHRKRMEGKANGYYAGPKVDFSKLVRDFLNDSESYLDEQRNTYEITTGIHGDIEHHYEVILGKGEQLTLTHAARERYGEEWLTSRRKTYTLNTFIDMVNTERKRANARIRTLKATGEKRYQDCELYEILPHWTADPDDGAEPLDAEQREALRLKVADQGTSPEEAEARHLTDAGGGPA